MKTILTLTLILSLTVLQTISAQEAEMAKVTLLRKGVTVTIKGEVKTPLADEELPLDATIQTNAMGFLEFEYKGAIHTIKKNTTILLADAIKTGGDKNFQPGLKTEAAGVRGFDKTNKKKSKSKKKQDKDN